MSEYATEQLKFMGLPSITEFPVLTAQVVPSDISDIQENALDWVRKSCANLTLRLSEMPEWLEERVNFARYSMIPLCNLSEDMHCTMIDVLFAR